MFEFNAECYGILQVHPDQASRPRYHVVDWSDTYFKKKLSVIIVFLVNDGLFEHFLMKISRLSRNKRENENIQILFWTHVNVLFRTCYRMYSYVKFKAFSFFYQKIIEIHKRGLVVSLGLPGLRTSPCWTLVKDRNAELQHRSLSWHCKQSVECSVAVDANTMATSCTTSTLATLRKSYLLVLAG